MIFEIGPFEFYRHKNGTLDIGVKCLDWAPFGWEYGWRDEDRGHIDKPIVQLRIGKLNVLYLELWFKKNSWRGFEFWFMGFWFMWSKDRIK